MHIHNWRRERYEVTSFSSVMPEYIIRTECTECGATGEKVVYEALVDAALDSSLAGMLYGLDSPQAN